MSQYGYTLLAETLPVARKTHRCIWCGEAIRPGEKYRDERSIFYGSFQNHKWHPECNKAAQDEMREWGEEEFSPYDNERPTAPAREAESTLIAPSAPLLGEATIYRATE